MKQRWENHQKASKDQLKYATSNSNDTWFLKETLQWCWLMEFGEDETEKGNYGMSTHRISYNIKGNKHSKILRSHSHRSTNFQQHEKFISGNWLMCHMEPTYINIDLFLFCFPVLIRQRKHEIKYFGFKFFEFLNKYHSSKYNGGPRNQIGGKAIRRVEMPE